MPLIADAACQNDLSARITSPASDLTLIYSHITQFTVVGNSQPNENPIPSSTTQTDHVMHDPIELTITGNISCVGCTQASSTQDVVLNLEQARRQTVYTPNNFFDIVTNRVNRYSKMILVGFNVNLDDQRLQTMNITMNFRASNIAGNIPNPSAEFGGVS